MDAVIIVQRRVPVGHAVLRDVDRDVVVVVLEPVHHLPNAKRSHEQPVGP